MIIHRLADNKEDIDITGNTVCVVHKTMNIQSFGDNKLDVTGTQRSENYVALLFFTVLISTFIKRTISWKCSA